MIKGLASPAVAILIVNGAASYATATLDGRDYLNHVVVPWQASAQTLAHELGHALFGLGDEYGSPHDDRCWPKLPFETVAGDPDVAVPNLTIAQKGTRWSGVLQGTELGGSGYSCGIYNPLGRCMMESSSQSQFCPVCLREFDLLFAAQAGANDGPPRCEFGVKRGSSLWQSLPSDSLFVAGHYRDFNGLREWELRIDGVRTVRTEVAGAFKRAWFGAFTAIIDSVARGSHLIRLECTDDLGTAMSSEAVVTVD